MNINPDNWYQLYKRSSRDKAREISLSGLRRERQKVYRTDNKSDPSHGGSSGYPLWYRTQVMHHVYHFGYDDAVQHFGISLSTLYRWNNDLFPKQQRGNAERKKLVGRDQMLLSIAIFQRPTATVDEVSLFIYLNGGDIYSRQQIYKRLHELKVTRKRASIETYEAFSPLNILKAYIYWTEPPRFGIKDVPRHRLIDIDEAHFTLKALTNKFGYAKKPVRVRDTGHYKRGRSYINLIIAVEAGNPAIPDHLLGSTMRPRRWFSITQGGTVNQHVFAHFIDTLCTNIESHPKEGDEFRIFIWDNLSVHLTDVVHAMLELRPTREEHQFISINRPPYQPKFAPVEYIICQIANDLSLKEHRNWDLDTLENECHNVCMTVGNDGAADRTFFHIGYTL